MKNRKSLQEALVSAKRQFQLMEAKTAIVMGQDLAVETWFDFRLDDLQKYSEMTANAKLAYELRTSPLAEVMEE